MADPVAPRHILVMDFEATCDSDDIVIKSVGADARISTSKHRLATGDRIKYFRESRNFWGGTALWAGGKEVADDADFFVRVVDSSTLELFNTTEEITKGGIPVRVEPGSGQGTTFKDQATSRRIAGVDAGQILSPNHRLCTGNGAKYFKGAGAPLSEAGKELKDGTNFFVAAVSPDLLALYRSKKDAESHQNPVMLDQGTGANAELQVRAGIHWVAEIIEFPGVLLDAATMEPVAEFRELVRPTETPYLPEFTTQLTSITQAEVDKAEPLASVLARFQAWLVEHGAEELLPVTCGDWDLNIMLATEAKRKGLDGLVPPCLRLWCNIKRPFGEALGCDRAPGMDGMLKELGIELVGHHHLGIDDCRNIASILQALVSRFNATVEVTMRKDVKEVKEVAAPKGKAQGSGEKKAAAVPAKEPGAAAAVRTSATSIRVSRDYLSSIGLEV